MPDTVIRVQNLSKRYRLGELHKQTGSFREKVTESFKRLVLRGKDGKPPGYANPSYSQPDSLHSMPHACPVESQKYSTGAPGSMPSSSDDFIWALKDVSFEVKRGEVLGIIGRNGAGKSTLLKILSRITKPTQGKAWIYGRVGSLLEVGTGFHAELTGRENIFLNGAILGMNRAEIKRKFDEIVDFAEIEKFIDTPVKRYSSGMYVRLSFAVAAHFEPEILLVDEVLAVGDMRFQKRCLGKMNEVSRTGRTVLFVSHNMGSISKLCNSGIVLEAGKNIVYGRASEAIRVYTQSMSANGDLDNRQFFGPLTGKVEFDRITVNGSGKDEGLVITPGSKISITAWGNAKENIPLFRSAVSIFKGDILVLTQHDGLEPEFLPCGRFKSEVEIPPYFLSPGEYSVTIGGYTVNTNDWTWATDQMRFYIMDEWSEEYDTIANMGIVNLQLRGRREPLS